MSTEQQLQQLELLNQLIGELENEMWYNIHTDSPHQAAKVKRWQDQLKEQANALHIHLQTNKQ